MIDAQFSFSSARFVQRYVDTLKKPLDYIILSHSHPDHWFGAEIFGAKTITTRSISKDIQAEGFYYIRRLKSRMKDNIPDTLPVIDDGLNVGETDFDGLKVMIKQYSDTEDNNSLVFEFPDYKVIIVQDLLYNAKHLVVSTREKNGNWITVLEGLRSQKYHTFLVGHGTNGGSSLINYNIRYLVNFERIAQSSTSNKRIYEKMDELYPNNKSSLNLLKRGLNRRFSKK